MRVFCESRGFAIARCKEGKNGVNVIFCKISITIEEHNQLINDTLDSADRLFIALQKDLISPSCDLRIRKCLLDSPQINIIKAEQEEWFGILDLDVFFFQLRLNSLLFFETFLRNSSKPSDLICNRSPPDNWFWNLRK